MAISRQKGVTQMTTLDCLSKTVENYSKMEEEETKSDNSDKKIYNVLTFGNNGSHKNQGHELLYSDGKRKTFSFDE